MNSLESKLKEVINLLTAMNCRFAVAGGIVANIYRKDIRTTLDVDFLFFTENDVDKAADEVLSKLGLSVAMVKEHQLKRTPTMNKKRQSNMIAVGRKKDAKDEIGVDLLLPPFPWFNKALERAQKHVLDFGFAKVPAVTVEDMIVIKLSAGRTKDIDDLESMFAVNHTLDLDYISSEMKRINLTIPRALQEIAPKALSKIKKI